MLNFMYLFRAYLLFLTYSLLRLVAVHVFEVGVQVGSALVVWTVVYLVDVALLGWLVLILLLGELSYLLVAEVLNSRLEGLVQDHRVY